jgi:hypothetical protein
MSQSFSSENDLTSKLLRHGMIFAPEYLVIDNGFKAFAIQDR